MKSLYRATTLAVAFTAALVLSLLAANEPATARDRTQTRTSGERVAVPLAIIDVSDGDTVNIQWSEDDRERVRILGIDTPEVAHPHWGQYQDQPFGPEATAFAKGAFATATEVQLLRAAETDGYGRTLGYLFVNGMNYSVLVIEAGYAVETVSHYGDNGFPEISETILAASRRAGPVAFEAPHLFRKRMRELQDWRKEHSPED